MIELGRYHGALFFSGLDEDTLTQFTQSVASTLEDYGHPVEQHSVMNAKQATVAASHYHISLTISAPELPSDHMQRTLRLDAISRLNQPDSESNAGPRRLEIDMIAADAKRDDKELSELILVVMLYRLVELYPVSAVEWLSPDTVLTLKQFLTPFSNLSSRLAYDDLAESFQTTQAKETPDFEKTAAHIKSVDSSANESLAQVFRTAPQPSDLEAVRNQNRPQNRVHRLAIWGMTGMVFFLSAPVAIAMAAVNLIRGEDFRLNTQVLSFSGLLVSLQNSGALASFVSRLPL